MVFMGSNPMGGRILWLAACRLDGGPAAQEQSCARSHFITGEFARCSRHTAAIAETAADESQDDDRCCP